MWFYIFLLMFTASLDNSTVVKTQSDLDNVILNSKNIKNAVCPAICRWFEKSQLTSLKNSIEIQTFNDFDTFTLTPLNTKHKTCPLIIECSREKDKFTSILFKTQDGRILLNETIVNIDNINYFVHYGTRIWTDEDTGKTYKIVRLKYIVGETVRIISFIVKDDLYTITEVCELWHDYTYRMMDYNGEVFRNYTSVEDFINNDLTNLRTKRIPYGETVFRFRYDEDCRVGLWGGVLTSEDKGILPKVGKKDFYYIPSYGNCLYLDYLQRQSYKD